MKSRNFPARKLARQLRADWRNRHPLNAEEREQAKELRAAGVRGMRMLENATVLEASRAIRTKKDRTGTGRVKR